MPTINLEMMKQLLDEFSTKEALVTEEIKVVEEEIRSLKHRIDAYRQKLQNISNDKAKLLAMQERYAMGGFRRTEDSEIQESPTITSESSVRVHSRRRENTVTTSALVAETPVSPLAEFTQQVSIDTSTLSETKAPSQIVESYTSATSISESNSILTDAWGTSETPEPQPWMPVESSIPGSNPWENTDTTSMNSEPWRPAELEAVQETAAQTEANTAPKQVDESQQPDQSKNLIEEEGEENNEQLRSINDALKGLFRK